MRQIQQLRAKSCLETIAALWSCKLNESQAGNVVFLLVWSLFIPALSWLHKRDASTNPS